MSCQAVGVRLGSLPTSFFLPVVLVAGEACGAVPDGGLSTLGQVPRLDRNILPRGKPVRRLVSQGTEQTVAVDPRSACMLTVRGKRTLPYWWGAGHRGWNVQSGERPAYEHWWLAVIAERRCWPPRDDRVEVDKVPICIALNLSAAVATRVVDATRPARGRAGVESREEVLATSLEFLATHPSPPLPSLPHGGAGEIR